MLWRFGVVGSADAEAGVGVGGAGAAGGAAEASARPRAIYLLPDNGKERGPDGKRLPAEERLKLVARPATERIEQLESELARWRGIRAELEASVFEDDDEDVDDDWEDDEDGEGDDEIIIGQRDPSKDPKRSPKGPGLFVYSPNRGEWGLAFDRHVIDDGGVAVEDAMAADLDGDGRPDLIAGGRATHNLKVYWNRPAK